MKTMATGAPPVVAFRKASEPHGWMGNMAAYPIAHLGRRWKTPEALFQALRFDDEAIREAIRAEKSPMTAKFLARKREAETVIERTSARDVENMRLVLRLKLEQHPELVRQLIDTGDAQIVEDCTRRFRFGNDAELERFLRLQADLRAIEDRVRALKNSSLFWGAVLVDPSWLGANKLGRLWMELRAEATHREA